MEFHRLGVRCLTVLEHATMNAAAPALFAIWLLADKRTDTILALSVFVETAATPATELHRGIRGGLGHASRY